MSIPILDKDGNEQKLYTQEEVDNLLKNNQSGTSGSKVFLYNRSCFKQTGTDTADLDHYVLDTVFGESVTEYFVFIPGEPTQLVDRDPTEASLSFTMNVAKPAYVTAADSYDFGTNHMTGSGYDKLVIVSLNYVDV